MDMWKLLLLMLWISFSCYLVYAHLKQAILTATAAIIVEIRGKK